MKHQGDVYKEKLTEAVERFPSLPVVEIGVAGGTTSFYAIQILGEKRSKQWFLTVDPFGNKPYKAGISIQSMGYDDKMFRETMAQIKTMALAKEVNHCHWKLTSLDFIKIWPQIEFWDDGSIARKKFAFAFLDGDHDWDPVFQEFDWFYQHMDKGAIICIDDFNLLNGENEVLQRLKGFEGTWFFNYDDGHYRCYFTKA